MTARALAYIMIAATMLAGSVAAQQPLPEPDLLLAQRAPAPANPPSRGQAPQPAPAIQPPAPGPDGSPLPAPVASPAGPRPLRENQSMNVRTEVTVTDERPGAPPIKKTVAMVTGDGMFGSVRSQTAYTAPGGGAFNNAPFNVDATPIITIDNKVHVRLTLQYDVVPPTGPAEGSGVRFQGTSIRESLALVLESGKPLVAVQSTDPVSDRKVSVEIKATILK
jgi:hypothetical protein